MRTVLVTAIGSFSAKMVIRNLKRDGYRVIGCDIYAANWVVNSVEADKFYQAPYATDQEAYLLFLQTICEAEAVDFLLPLTDLEIDVLNKSEFRSGQMSRLLISSQDTIEICRDKLKLEQFLAPRQLCKTIAGVPLRDAVAAELSYPVVVKPCHGRSSQGLRFVNDEAAFNGLRQDPQMMAGEYLVQPWIEGMVVTVDVVRNPLDNQVVCVSRRELLRTANGCGTTVHMFDDPKLNQICTAIAAALNICGCVNFEFIETPSGEWYFLECNPRFSGGVVFSCMAGYDMISNHMNCFLKQKLDAKLPITEQYLARRYEEYQM